LELRSDGTGKVGSIHLDESRITASQVLEVVHDLVQNMRVVMDGEQTDSVGHRSPSGFETSQSFNVANVVITGEIAEIV
jgi:hypothetical protein